MIFYRNLWGRFILVALIMTCQGASADTDFGLYDPVAPDGSAFVRFINMTDDEVTPQLNRKKFDALTNNQVSDYFVVPKGPVRFFVGDQKADHDIVAGKFYTVVNSKNIVVLEDIANNNRSKATIAFYNFSGISSLTLKAKGGAVNVLQDVESDSTKARDMNAVKIDFSIYNGEEFLVELSEEIIERGNHYSIFYDGTAAQFVTATTNTRK